MPMQAHSKTPLDNSTNLKSEVPDIEGEIIEQVEQMYGEYVTIVQAFYIGKMIGIFGPKRTSAALHEHRHKLDPIRYAYKALVSKQYGKGRSQEEPKDVQYPDLDNWSW